MRRKAAETKRGFRIGQRVVVPNGEQGIVTAIAPMGCTVLVEFADGDEDFFSVDQLVAARVSR